jgi:hypothetical protein
MTRIAIAVLGASSLVLAACGGSDDGGSSDAKSGAVEFFNAFADGEGAELDKSCVETAVATLSDTDAQTLADQDPASPDGEAFNEAIDVVGDRIFDECVTGEE